MLNQYGCICSRVRENKCTNSFSGRIWFIFDLAQCVICLYTAGMLLVSGRLNYSFEVKIMKKSHTLARPCNEHRYEYPKTPSHMYQQTEYPKQGSKCHGMAWVT